MSTNPAPYTMAFESYGATVGLELPSQDLLDLVLPLIPEPWQPIDPQAVDTRFTLLPMNPGESDVPSYGFKLLANGERVRWIPSVETLVEAMEDTLHLHVAEWANPWVFLHAGVVAIDGRAIILPATSMSGKSTLVHAMVESGATYYSDEYAILDTRGMVWPFRRALSLRSGPFGEERRVSRRHGPEPDPVPVALVAFLTYQEGATLDVTPIPATAATMLGAMQSVGIRRFPERTMGAITHLTSQAACYQGTRGDYREAVAWIRETLTSIPR